MDLCDKLRPYLLFVSVLIHPDTGQEYILLGENHRQTAILPVSTKQSIIETLIEFSERRKSTLFLETHQQYLQDQKLYHDSGYEVGITEHQHFLPLFAEAAKHLSVKHFDLRPDISPVFNTDLDVLSHILVSQPSSLSLTTLDFLFLQPCSLYLLKNKKEYSTELLNLFRDSFHAATEASRLDLREINYFLFQMPTIIVDLNLADMLLDNTDLSNIIYGGNFHIENIYKELTSRGFVET